MRLPFFGQQKILLAYEYGLIFAISAQKQGVEITPELSKKFEDMLLNEFKKKTPMQLSIDMYANILSVFETNLDK